MVARSKAARLANANEYKRNLNVGSGQGIMVRLTCMAFLSDSKRNDEESVSIEEEIFDSLSLPFGKEVENAATKLYEKFVKRVNEETPMHE